MRFSIPLSPSNFTISANESLQATSLQTLGNARASRFVVIIKRHNSDALYSRRLPPKKSKEVQLKRCYRCVNPITILHSKYTLFPELSVISPSTWLRGMLWRSRRASLPVYPGARIRACMCVVCTRHVWNNVLSIDYYVYYMYYMYRVPLEHAVHTRRTYTMETYDVRGRHRFNRISRKSEI